MELKVLSLRYSSWSMRPWLALKSTGADFKTTTVKIEVKQQVKSASGTLENVVDDHDKELAARRNLGSVTGKFPVLLVGDERIHESLAICEFVAEKFPQAKLWPDDMITRAKARAVCLEMATGFANVRDQLSCHLFATLDLSKKLRPETELEIRRIFEIFSENLATYGGPFLFGRWSIADVVYFPVLTRFKTYCIALPEDIQAYQQAVYGHPSVQELFKLAPHEPALPSYDEKILKLGGQLTL